MQTEIIHTILFRNSSNWLIKTSGLVHKSYINQSCFLPKQFLVEKKLLERHLEPIRSYVLPHLNNFLSLINGY
jgi:hypothetical protein